MSIAPLRFFEIYQAVNFHFKDVKYDYFKYNGQINVNSKSLLGHKNKYHFEKFAKKAGNEQEALEFCVANVIDGKKYIVMFDDASYTKWIAHRDSLNYRFEQELNKYLELKKQHNIVDLCHSDQISPEFVIIFNYILDGYLFEQLDKSPNFIWQELKKRLQKYTPFVLNLWLIDKKKLRQIAQQSA